MFGALFIVGGIIGSGIYGAIVEKYKKFKVIMNILCVNSCISTLALMFCFISEIPGLSAALCFVVGFNMIPVMVIGFEFGAETTYPLGEMMSGGFLMSAGNLLGIVYTVIASIMLDNMVGTKPCVISLSVYVGSCFFGILFSILLKEDLRRQRAETLKNALESVLTEEGDKSLPPIS
mmetsp:Transcript_33076/g.32202  ORF Transcript_33076/g.32202 Transcript_33076/m.32202 type:complete len:177 (-) Transcript_33076:17-547(-)